MRINKELIKIIDRWEDNLNYWKGERHIENKKFSEGVLIGIKSALDNIEVPSNTQMQIYTKPCTYNHKLYYEFHGYNNCPMCGMALHD